MLSKKEMIQEYTDAGLPGYDTIPSQQRIGLIGGVILELALAVVILTNNGSISNLVNILGFIVQGILVFAFFMAGFGKFKGKMGDMDFVLVFQYWRFPAFFRYIVAAFEMIGALLLLVGFFVQPLALFGGIGLVIVTLGAISTHIFIVNDTNGIPPFVLFTLAVIMTTINGITFLGA